MVHVAWEDVIAYAAWAAKAIPIEAEWEFACRGGHDGWLYAWGQGLAPKRRMLANYWQGNFPGRIWRGWSERTAPVSEVFLPMTIEGV